MKKSPFSIAVELRSEAALNATSSLISRKISSPNSS